MVKWEIRRFKDLSAVELYAILRLRSEVFVVEQNCVYQDIDGKDYTAFHLIGDFDEKMVCYARLFAPGAYFENASIGRVVVSQAYRDRKWGHDLINKAIAAIKSEFGVDEITISAQLYLKKFYESHGFNAVGEQYLEDDIPHIKMVRE